MQKDTTITKSLSKKDAVALECVRSSCATDAGYLQGESRFSPSVEWASIVRAMGEQWVNNG